MKILITVTYYSPYISGLTLAVRNLAELMAKNEYKVTVLTTQYEKKLPQCEVIEQVKVKRIPYLIRISKGFLYKGFLTEIIKAISNTDQVIINLPQFEGILIAITAKLLKKKVHCYYHCNVRSEGGFLSSFVTYLLRISNSISLSFADTIIATSEDFALHDALMKKYKHKLVYAYPVMKVQQLTPKTQKVITEKKQEFDGYKIGFVGRFAKEKGLEYLLKSIPVIRKNIGNQFKLFLVGSNKAVGESAYGDSIMSLIQQYKEYVSYLGVISDDELGAFYASLDVLVIPSINSTEAFGMVQVEAMYFGVPAVVTDLPGVRVPVQKTGMGEIIPIKNSEKLGQAISIVLKNPRKYKKDSQFVRSEFSNEKVIRIFKKILTVS